MTQPPYPPPYPPAPHDPFGRGPRYSDPLLATRRASTLMWILAVLGVMFGLCAGLVSREMTPDQIAKLPQGAQILQLERDTGITMHGVYLVMSFVAIGVSGGLGALAFPVRRGSIGAMVAAIVVVGFVCAFLLMSLLGALMGGAAGLVGACVLILPLAICGMLIAALIQAFRSVSAVRQGVRMEQWAQAMRQQQPGGAPSPAAPDGNPSAARAESRPAPSPTATWPAQSPTLPSNPLPPTPNLFGPAPFGIPPPPGDTPPGLYGYATRPAEAPPAPEPTEPPGTGSPG